MIKIEINRRPTKEIPKGTRHVVKCKCGNITMASDKTIPPIMAEACKDVPCSKCMPPDEFAKQVYGK